jgi:hypothetical protein
MNTSLVVKVQASLTPTVPHHAFALLAFEPVTSTYQNSSKAIVEMQASADSKETCNAFITLAYEHLIKNKIPSSFQLIVRYKRMYQRKSQQSLADNLSCVPCIGIKLAHKLVRFHRTPPKIFNALRAAGRMLPDFEEKFFIAFGIFLPPESLLPFKAANRNSLANCWLQ